jgi:two-component system phosphate regulon sensor histidine kinase PhoR
MRIFKIHIVTIVLVSSLLGLIAVQGILLNLQIEVLRDQFKDLAYMTMLDIHHNIEDDSELSEQLIIILESYEAGTDITPAQAAHVINEIQYRIDSICHENGINIDTDFLFYKTKGEEIIIHSQPENPEAANIPEFTIKAGWRIRAALGEGKYRIGVIFHKKHSYFLQELSILVIVSGMIFLILCTSIFIALRNWRLQKDFSEHKNNFINNLTHELKTPIFSTSLIHKVLHEKIDQMDAATLSKYMPMLESENKKLSTMVERVMDIARIDQGSPEMQLEKCNIHDIIEESTNTFSVRFVHNEGRLNLFLNAENHLIRADKVHMSNVLINLMDNAVKYNRNPPVITVETGNKNGNLVIAVKDNGIGIGKRDQAYVFDKFFRVNTGDKHEVKGDGIGLSYVKMVIQQHQGKIAVEGSPGEGTIFRILLPILK